MSSKRREAAKELLLADYRYLSESFWKSEETGETRVKFFITLVTAVFAGLVGLVELKIKGSSGPPVKFIHLVKDETLNYIFHFSLFMLLVFGMVTLFRILKRNRATDGYKRGMDEIRQRFKDYYGSDDILNGYYPHGGRLQCYQKKSEEEQNKQKDKIEVRKFGGLAHSAAALNSIILAAMATLAVLRLNPLDNDFLAAWFIIWFISSFCMQVGLINNHEVNYNKKFSTTTYTHAGAIVVMQEEGVAKVLLVSSRDKPEIFVLPKGHIKNGEHEGHGEAALREVFEETGIMARVGEPVGAISFEREHTKEEEKEGAEKSRLAVLKQPIGQWFNKGKKATTEQIKVKLYLMQYVANLNKIPDKSPEGRLLKWFALDEAMAELAPFPETQWVLARAKHVLTCMPAPQN